MSAKEVPVWQLNYLKKKSVFGESYDLSNRSLKLRFDVDAHRATIRCR